MEIFFSYAHEDETLRDELAKHLKNLERQGIIQSWHDRQILPGAEWDHSIDTHLDTADVILLLVSNDFIASDYCYDVEIKRAMERHEAGDAIVIPVILRPVDWQGTPFSKLQALPKNATPITTWTNQDQACLDVVRGIRAVVEKIKVREKEDMKDEGEDRGRKRQQETENRERQKQASVQMNFYGTVYGAVGNVEGNQNIGIEKKDQG